MTVSELAEKMTIRGIMVIDEDGDTSMEDWNDATRERFGDIKVRRVGQGLYESPWETRQYPQETISFGLVVAVA